MSAQEQLGKVLFFDATLSANKNQSCAACHNPASGWTGDLLEINKGGGVYEGSIAGEFGERKPPTSAYAKQSPILTLEEEGLIVGGSFWDGRATGWTLGDATAEQAQGPFLNPVEQALPDSACLIYRVCASPNIDNALFAEIVGEAACQIAWPDNADAVCGERGEGFLNALAEQDQQTVAAAYDQIGHAVAAYEGSLEVNPFSSKFDVEGPEGKLTELERQGFDLFMGKGLCSECHPGTGENALFTDFSYDNLGIPKNPDNPVYAKSPDFVDPGLGGFLATLDEKPEFKALADDNKGTHKVPTVRNVSLGEEAFAKAYGHNAYFKSLEQMVHFYNTRDAKPRCETDLRAADAIAANCWPAPEVAENVNVEELGDLGLTPEEELAIVAFMRTLSDGYTG